LKRFISATLVAPFFAHALFQRAVGPQERVGQEESERAEQQHGHGEEGVEQHRVFGLVLFLGMGIEFGEANSGRRMAFLAGLQDIFLRERRILAVNPLNVMEAVAICTLCRSCIPELRHFTMVRFAVRLYFFGMAVPALFDQ